MCQHYQMWSQYYSCLCLSILTRSCCGRVNKFFLVLSFSTPTHKILLSAIPILSCAWLTLKEGLEVAHGAPLFSASSEVSWADGRLPSVLRTQNPIRYQVQQLGVPVWPGRRGRQRHLTSNRMHLCGCRGRLPQEVLPYFHDKLSFMRAMCWTNQVNWEARNPHWAYLSFLLKAVSTGRLTGSLLSPWLVRSVDRQRMEAWLNALRALWT